VTRERVAEYLAPLASPGTFAALRSLGSSLEGRASQVEDALGRIAAPTLVVWGADDRWIPPAHADRFVSAIPGARKVVIPACGHVPQEERPAEVGRLLLEFLSEAGSARAQGHAGSEASRG
jgi:pimeloyl-ACP methyl ester carboxylesterase